MNQFLKDTWAFWGLMIFAVGITLLVVIPASAEENSESIDPLEIDQNQVDDEISRTIHVHLQDELSSSDGIR